MQNKEVEAAEDDNQAAPVNAYSIRRGAAEDLQTAFQLVEEYFREIGVLVRDTRTEFANHLRSNRVAFGWHLTADSRLAALSSTHWLRYPEAVKSNVCTFG